MRRQPRLCPQSSPEEEGVPALPVLVSSLTPSVPIRSLHSNQGGRAGVLPQVCLTPEGHPAPLLQPDSVLKTNCWAKKRHLGLPGHLGYPGSSPSAPHDPMSGEPDLSAADCLLPPLEPWAAGRLALL